MVWTSERPSKQGWYWFKPNRNSPRVVWLVADDHDENFLLAYWVNIVGEARSEFVSTLTGQWSGPIPAPDPAPEGG